MQPLPVRSVAPLRRLADDLLKHPAVLIPRHQLLHAFAACLGYSAWESLVEAISPDAPDWVRDQDLSPDALAQRRVEQARQLASSISFPFSNSIDIAQALSPTRDFRRPPPRGLETSNQQALRAQCDYPDEWWVSSAQLLHPLAPSGWHIGEMLNLADRAAQMGRDDDDEGGVRLLDLSGVRRQSVLLPPDWHDSPWQIFAGHVVLKLDEALRIQPTAWSFVFDKMKVPKRFPSDFDFFPYANLEDALRKVPADLKRYTQLKAWASSTRIRETEGLQFPASVRLNHGHSAFWPLTPLIENPAQAAAWRMGEEQARALG